MKGSVKLMGKKRFTPEYKEEIIKLVTERKKKMSEVAKDIGVTATSIRRWIRQYSEYGKNAFPGKGYLRTEDDKIRKLMRENIDLKEENKILKKAMAIFSRDVK
jgi:transposase